MTYAIRGRQFVVVSAGGYDGLPVAFGDSILAYALP
jgi:glucose dehydrogenase